MKIILSATLLLTVALAWSQPRPEINLEDFAEQLFQVQDEDISYEDLYESLLLFYTSPINLNKADHAQLASLYILSPLQLNNFLNYRKNQGKLLSIYELQAIPGFTDATIRDLLPFVTVKETSDSRPLVTRILTEENNYLLLRYSRTLQPQEGYLREDGSGYTGDRNTLYGRFRVSHPNDFSLGLTFEKDAGEQFSIRPSAGRYGFDFYSFHFFLQHKGRLKSLAIGDYQLQFGQGLVLGSGFGAGKGAETTNTVKRNTVGVRPYASSLESGFFRGAASTLTFGNFRTTIFASRLQQDGNLQNDTTYSDFAEYVNSIQATGYHRTPTELAAKNQVEESSVGFALDHQVSHSLSLGATGLFSHFSKPIQKKPNNYNQYEFSGHQNMLGSLFANYNWQNFMLFGEAAISRSGGFAGIGGFITSLSPALDLSMVFRKYEKDFHSFYANAFSEGSRIINEEGIYWGLKYHPGRKYEFALYLDKFKFPWLRYRVNAPSEGFEYLTRFTYKPSRSIKLYAQYREERKAINSAAATQLSQVVPTIKRNYLVNVDYSLGRFFGLKTRVQGSVYQQEGNTTRGLALIQDLNFVYGQWKFSSRYAVFDTDNFNNAQYSYERDVLYAFSFPAYNGAGIRAYLLAQFRATSRLTLWLRYSSFAYTHVNQIGSGLSRINGSGKSEIKSMIRYRF